MMVALKYVQILQAKRSLSGIVMVILMVTMEKEILEFID